MKGDVTSMFNCFKLPNDIFDYNLSCTDMVVLAALYSCKCHVITNTGDKIIRIKQATIANICGIKSLTTVSKAINKIFRCGFIKRVSRFKKSNGDYGTFVYVIPAVTSNYFFVDRNIFKYELSRPQMRMYLYLCKCACSSTRKSWNSYNDIANALKITRTACISTIKALLQLHVISKKLTKKSDGSYSDNHYIIITLSYKIKFCKKKRLHSNTVNSCSYVFVKYAYLQKNNTTVNKHCQAHLKKSSLYTIYLSFFNSRGSPLKCNSIFSTHNNSNRKRNI